MSDRYLLAPDLNVPKTQRATARFLVAAGSAGFVLLAVYLVGTRTGAGKNIDLAAYQYGPKASLLSFSFVDSRLQYLDAHTLKEVVVVLFVIGLVRGRPLLGLGAAFAAGAPVLATHFLRYHVLDHHPLAPTGVVGSTFPSGHSATAIACGMGFVLVSPARVRGLVAVFFATLGLMVAVQVQVVGWHQMIDSVGAALLSFSFAAGTAAVLAAATRRNAVAREAHWPSIGLLAAGALVAAVAVVVALLAGVDLQSAAAATHTEARNAYVMALAVNGVAVAALFAALLWIIGDDSYDPDQFRFRWRTDRWPLVGAGRYGRTGANR